MDAQPGGIFADDAGEGGLDAVVIDDVAADEDIAPLDLFAQHGAHLGNFHQHRIEEIVDLETPVHRLVLERGMAIAQRPFVARQCQLALARGAEHGAAQHRR